MGETEGSTRNSACLVFKEFFADDDTDNPYDDDNPVVVVGARCLGTSIFNLVNCHERFQVSCTVAKHSQCGEAFDEGLYDIFLSITNALCHHL